MVSPLHSIQKLIDVCENKKREQEKYSGDFKRALYLWHNYLMSGWSLSNPKEEKQFANLKNRIRTISLSIETSDFEKVELFFRYGRWGINTTYEVQAYRMTINLFDPYALHYAVGKRTYVEKLQEQTNQAKLQYQAENQANEMIEVSIDTKRNAKEVYTLDAFSSEAFNHESSQLLTPNKIYIGKKLISLNECLPVEKMRSRENGVDPNGLGVFATTIGKREKQEDTITMTRIRIGNKDCPFHAVYDGHHGDQVAKYLEKNLHLRIQSKLPKLNLINEEVFLDKVIQAFYEVNEEIRQSKELRTAGATAICTIIYADTIYTFSTGDCCALLLDRSENAEEPIVPLNEFARTPNPRFERGMERLGGALTPSKNRVEIVSERSSVESPRAFGDNCVSGIAVRPKITKVPVPVNKNGVLYLSCDGPFEKITRQTLGMKALDLLKQNMNLEIVAIQLLERAYESQSTDNITIVMCDLAGL